MRLKSKEPHRKRNWKALLKRNFFAWAILLPPLLLFCFFVWVPMARNILLSFQKDYSDPSFVGFSNYASVFQDESFLMALGNTFKYIAWSLVIGYLVPVLLGFLLSEIVHAKGFFRVVLYLPCMISGIATVFLFKNMFGDESTSLFNVITLAFGGEAHSWRSDTNLIIPLIVLAMTWRGAGSTSLIYLSAFQSIDNSMYEAARMDGANSIQRFCHVTIPALKGTLLTLFVLQIISVFQVFYEPMIIGPDGGPLNASMSLMLQSYLYAFRSTSLGFQYGKSAATAMILSLIIMAFTALYSLLKNLLRQAEGGK
ncbi:MAG TPA: sugar ABC transporter permease [Firmicutes bacterium]|nr:sugar ABC transporter permease [Bacillota bacterium]